MNESKNRLGCTVVCKLMPLYRLGVFQELSASKDIRYTFLGDTVVQAGIESIDWEYANRQNGGINWIKTRNFFYRPELLFWQTGVLRRILFSKDKVFIFEGAVSHIPYWIFPVICRLVGKKALFWTHGFRGVDSGVKKRIRKFFFKRLPHGLLLYGDYNKELMVESGFNSNKLFVIYNSLDLNKQLEVMSSHKAVVSDEYRAHRTNFTLIFIGRLVSGKGVLTILDIVRKFRNETLPIDCVIIGSGPEKKFLQQYCIENEIEEHVLFTGALYDEEEIGKYFLKADLLVSPGNVGLNCIHALAYGVPVATHNDFRFQNPEVEAISDQINGFFYKRDDLEDFYVKIRAWMKNNPDREILSQQCRKVINEKYNPRNHAKLISDAVKKVM